MYRAREGEGEREGATNHTTVAPDSSRRNPTYSTDRVMTASVSLQGAKYIHTIHVHLVLVQSSADKDCLREKFTQQQILELSSLPLLSAMPRKLLPMPPSEWHIYYEICKAAFRPGIMSVMFPHGISDQDSAISLATMKRAAERYPGRIQIYKVVDTDLPDDDPLQQVIGVSNWRIYDEERTEEDFQREKEESERDTAELGDPPGVDLAVVQDFHGVVQEYRKKHFGGKPYVLLYVLATRPDQARKGVGALSMEWGCKKADELGLPAYLEGSPQGVGLYKKWGFEVVDELPWDATKYGYPDSLKHLCMMRHPQQKEEK